MLILTEDWWKTISRINREVNSIPYQSDMSRYGTEEFWTEIDTSGDCEDYALEKRRRLIGAGVRVDDLSLAICVTERDEHHAVLVLHTDKGSYVLDNRRPDPLPWTDLPYTWIARQNGRRWEKIIAPGSST